MLVLADCGETPEDGERYAFVAVDNQTGDTTLDWATPLIHRGLSAAVGYSAASDTVAEARLFSGGANRTVYSTLTRGDVPGEVRLHSAIFDTNGHQFNREFTVTGNVLQVINRMATSINPDANSLGVKSEEAFRKWPVPAGGDGLAYDAQCLALAASDPGFGAALAACSDQLKDSAHFDTLRDLLARLPETQLREYSPEVLETLGNGYWTLKNYPQAANVFRIGALVRPAMKNMVGYSEALAGHCDAGRQALEEYARVPKHEANALDSLGEISFFCGKYKEAEQYFAAAEAKWLGNERGTLEPVKAAASRLMAGDAAGANQLANAQIDKLNKANPQGAASLKAAWGSIAATVGRDDQKRLIEQSLIRRP